VSIISECEFCRIVSTTDRTYTKQTELYDGIADVMMCVRCGDAAEFEQKRIIELLEPLGACEPSICGKGCRGEHRCIGWAYRHAIRLIKGDD
jgi:hypothetical protein